MQKIWDEHVVLARDGYPTILGIDLMLIHEVTSAQAFSLLQSRGIPVRDPGRLVATLDHSIPTRTNRSEIFDDQARKQVETLRINTRKHKIPLFDFESGHQGIVHVIGPELGLTHPGMTIVCGDSHTSTHGAFGALAFGVGTSEVGYVLASNCLLQQSPKTMKVEFRGKFSPGVYPKDAIMKLISEIGIAGANGHVIEYVGDAIREMTMEGRMTVCNMSIECGARAGLISPDETTVSYLRGKRYAPQPEVWDEAVAYWLSFASDLNATYDKTKTIDVASLKPMVTWGTNPEQAMEISARVPRISELPETHRAVAKTALNYVGLKEGQAIAGVPIQWAFIGSCTNGRIEDLRVAAHILKGKKVNRGITLYVVPGSEQVKAQAEQEGLAEIFLESGAQFRMPGCSLCLGMNDDRVPKGERCISSSNRNFVGRQGTGSITHLASPATVAASAITGVISSANDL